MRLGRWESTRSDHISIPSRADPTSRIKEHINAAPLVSMLCVDDSNQIASHACNVSPESSCRCDLDAFVVFHRSICSDLMSLGSGSRREFEANRSSIFAVLRKRGGCGRRRSSQIQDLKGLGQYGRAITGARTTLTTQSEHFPPTVLTRPRHPRGWLAQEYMVTGREGAPNGGSNNK